MTISFEYNREKDSWCLLTYGKSSFNSPTPTKSYEKLIEVCVDNPNKEATSAFIDTYLADTGIDVQERVSTYQKEWDTIATEYQKRAETIFKCTLSRDITAYMTINNRCPYSVQDNFFFVSLSGTTIRKTAIHELWHFFTWERFGSEWEEKLGKQTYNDIKESLTVLLNVECADLLPEGVLDTGYPQHKELREKILRLWSETKDIDTLWETLTTHSEM